MSDLFPNPKTDPVPLIVQLRKAREEASKEIGLAQRWLNNAVIGERDEMCRDLEPPLNAGNFVGDWEWYPRIYSLLIAINDLSALEKQSLPPKQRKKRL